VNREDVVTKKGFDPSLCLGLCAYALVYVAHGAAFLHIIAAYRTDYSYDVTYEVNVI
jgi:hypothetical protein